MNKQSLPIQLANAIEDGVATGEYKVGSAADCAAPELRRLNEIVETLSIWCDKSDALNKNVLATHFIRNVILQGSKFIPDQKENT